MDDGKQVPAGRPSRAGGGVLGSGLLVALVLVGAALGGSALAGPPGPPVVQPVDDCPPSLAAALPATGPSSTFLVPWGPVNARVCAYRGDGTGGAVRTAVLDATGAADLAGLLHRLPRAAGGCTAPATVAPGGGAAPADGEVAVVVFRYRPGGTPTVGVRLRVAAATSGDPGCRVVANGAAGRVVPPAAARRIADRVPALAPALGED